MRTYRPRLLALLASALLFGGVAAPLGAQPRSEYVHHRHLTIPGPDGRPSRLLVTIPRRPDRALHPPGVRYALLVALHGRGEAARGPNRGFLGWTNDYRLHVAFGALLRGELRREDYEGFVRDAHLDAVNAELARRPFEAPVVVTPYVPDGLLAPGAEEAREAYLAWLAGPLLEQVREAFPGVARTREGTGIDGVSMGGRIALEAGFAHPEAFAAVGGIQPAVRGDTDFLSGSVNPDLNQHIRLLTSDDDPYQRATRTLSAALRERQVPHTLLVTPGPHNYDYNRGPGAIELLRFHASVLVQEPLAEGEQIE